MGVHVSSIVNCGYWSSNINEVIRPVLNFFKVLNFTTTKKQKKNTRHQKALKSIKTQPI